MNTPAAKTNNTAETVAAFNTNQIANQNKPADTDPVIIPNDPKNEPVTLIPPPFIPTFQARVYMKASADAVEYLRLIVPKEIRDITAKPALWRSLKTTDKKEALEAAAVITVAFQEALQEIANIAEKSCTIGLNVEIETDNFLNLMESATKEDIAVIKDDLIKSFGTAPKQRKAGEPKTPKTAAKPSDPSASKRLQSFKRKRKQRTSNGRTNNRRN